MVLDCFSWYTVWLRVHRNCMTIASESGYETSSFMIVSTQNSSKCRKMVFFSIDPSGAPITIVFSGKTLHCWQHAFKLFWRLQWPLPNAKDNTHRVSGSRCSKWTGLDSPGHCLADSKQTGNKTSPKDLEPSLWSNTMNDDCLSFNAQ